MEFEKKQTLILPYKRVSETGVQEIRNYLRANRLLYMHFPMSWSWEWLVTEGQYRGKLPNRLAGMLKTRHDVKLTPEQKSVIGNIARKHLLAQDMYTIDFTNDLDWAAGDFGDHGSCFWGANSGAREVMEEEGVIAIRFYNKDGEGVGRAWLYELSGSAWVLFNAYGFECPEAASIFATKLREDTGDVWEYGELDNLLINGVARGFVYINNRPQIICKADCDLKLNISLEWDIPYYSCSSCGDWVYEDNLYHDEEDCESYCYDCYESLLGEREEQRLAELEERLEQEMEADYRDTARRPEIAHTMAQEVIRKDIRAQLVAGQLCLGTDFQMGLSLL